MESLKKSHEEYRSKCHMQSVKLSEMESLLQHKISEVESKQQELGHSEEKRRNLTSQVSCLKKEKEEIEELLGCRGMFW